MSRFIELTSATNQMSIFVNVNKIVNVYEVKRFVGFHTEKSTVLETVVRDVYVTEAYEKVKEMIQS